MKHVVRSKDRFTWCVVMTDEDGTACFWFETEPEAKKEAERLSEEDNARDICVCKLHWQNDL